MAEAIAKLRYLHVSPRKVRLLADLVRGMTLKEAKVQVALSLKKSAPAILKILKSAEANAKNDFKMNPDDLFIKEIKIDEGPVLKRYRPRARGRATMIRRRTSHVIVILSDEKS